MEQKSASSVFNDAMNLAKKVGNRYSQKTLLEQKAWIFMIHNLLKGEKFPIEEWFETNAQDLFVQFYGYYKSHNCWDGFKENILHNSGRMYALFVAAVYCLEQEDDKRKKLCLQALRENKSVDNNVLRILSDYSLKYPVLVEVIGELLKVQKNLKNVSSAELFQVYLDYREVNETLARKALDVLYLWFLKLQRPVDIAADYVNFQYRLRQQKFSQEEKAYHFEHLQKILQSLSLKKASTNICRIILDTLGMSFYKFDDRLSLVHTYLDDFISSARENDLMACLSSRICKEEFSAQMLFLISELQRKVCDNRRLSLELLDLIGEAWREETCVRLNVIMREAFNRETWECIEAYLKRGIFSKREEMWLELCCKTADLAASDIGYFSTQPLWFALKLKKLIAKYPILEKFKDYATQIFDDQMEALESFLEEDCNYICWNEWESDLNGFWSDATASEIATLVHLLAGYETADSRMKVWAKSKNFDFTNWGEKLKYAAQLERMLNQLDVD